MQPSLPVPQVDEFLRESSMQEGLSHCSSMHITSSVFINDDERGLHQDYDDWLKACVASYAVAPHKPVGKGLGALKYLAPYIFRVAISNNRILKLANGKVTFRYRRPDTGRLKTCTLPAEVFIRRFLQHVLPKSFVKVRYYGFLAPGCRQRLAALRQKLGCLAAHRSLASEVEDGDEQDSERGWSDVSVSGHTVLCPSCGQIMRRRSIRPGEARPRRRCPP